MALSKKILEDGFSSFMDQESPLFIAFPESGDDAALKWADTVNNYASAVTPVSLSSSAAREALYNIMRVITPQAMNAIPLMVSGVQAYAAALATGMQPTFTGVPPATPPPIPAVLPGLGLTGAPASVIVSALAEVIHTWFKTGTATNNSSGATVTWV